jgi:anti-anti-sigma factor
LINPLFLKPVGDRYRVGDFLREIVSFEPLNLRADRFPEDQDLILCRNVLIYFEDEMIETLVSGFHRSLAPGGHLCVGSADNILRFDAFFTPMRVAEATIYRRWSTDRRESTVPVPAIRGEKRRQRVEIPRVKAWCENELHHMTITGVAGESASQFEARLVEVVPAGWTRLVVDLSNLLYISNESLHGLKRFLASGNEAGAETTIMAPDPRVRECLGQVRFGARTRISASHEKRAFNPVTLAAAAAPSASVRPRSERRTPIAREVVPAPPKSAIPGAGGTAWHPAAAPPKSAIPDATPPSRKEYYRITRQERDGVIIVSCSGDLDAEKSPEIHQKLNRALEPAIEARRPRVIIDLAEVAFFDDSHAALFGRAARLARDRRGCFLVATRSDAVVRILARQPEPVTVTGAVADAFTLLETAGMA